MTFIMKSNDSCRHLRERERENNPGLSTKFSQFNTRSCLSNSTCKTVKRNNRKRNQSKSSDIPSCADKENQPMKQNSAKMLRKKKYEPTKVSLLKKKKRPSKILQDVPLKDEEKYIKRRNDCQTTVGNFSQKIAEEDIKIIHKCLNTVRAARVSSKSATAKNSNESGNKLTMNNQIEIYNMILSILSHSPYHKKLMSQILIELEDLQNQELIEQTLKQTCIALPDRNSFGSNSSRMTSRVVSYFKSPRKPLERKISPSPAIKAPTTKMKQLVKEIDEMIISPSNPNNRSKSIENLNEESDAIEMLAIRKELGRLMVRLAISCPKNEDSNKKLKTKCFAMYSPGSSVVGRKKLGGGKKKTLRRVSNEFRARRSASGGSVFSRLMTNTVSTAAKRNTKKNRLDAAVSLTKRTHISRQKQPSNYHEQEQEQLFTQLRPSSSSSLSFTTALSSLGEDATLSPGSQTYSISSTDSFSDRILKKNVSPSTFSFTSPIADDGVNIAQISLNENVLTTTEKKCAEILSSNKEGFDEPKSEISSEKKEARDEQILPAVENCRNIFLSSKQGFDGKNFFTLSEVNEKQEEQSSIQTLLPQKVASAAHQVSVAPHPPYLTITKKNKAQDISSFASPTNEQNTTTTDQHHCVIAKRAQDFFEQQLRLSDQSSFDVSKNTTSKRNATITSNSRLLIGTESSRNRISNVSFGNKSVSYLGEEGCDGGDAGTSVTSPISSNNIVDKRLEFSTPSTGSNFTSAAVKTAPMNRRRSSHMSACSINKNSHMTKSIGAVTSNNNRRNNTTSKKKQSSSTSYQGNDDLENQIIQELYQSPPKTTWNDIAGLEDAKMSVQESIILPFLRPDLYTGLRKPPRGILLYGPPGTGKTMIARAAASESNLSFFACSASTLTSKWVGESEKLVRALFIVAKRLGPSIVFLDELDSILSARGRSTNENESSRRLKTEFMVQVDGVRTNSGGSGEKEEGHTGGSDCNNSHVLVLGCSNCPWDLDQAVLRRFERRIYVPLPDDDARQCMISKLLESNRHNLSPRQLGKLVALTEGYSCSDLISLGSEASFGPLRSLGGMMDIINAKHVCSSNDLRPISFEDFETALSNGKQRRSVSGDLLKKYAAWETEQSI